MSVRTSRLKRVLALGVLGALLSPSLGCGSKGRASKGDDEALSPAEKLFEDGEKNAGYATKACKKVFRDCQFEGSSKEDDGVSIGLTAVLDASIADSLSVEPKLDVRVAVTKHASYSEAKKLEKESSAEACFVRGPVLGKPYTVTFSCEGKSQRACCDILVKGKFDVMLSELAPLY